MAILTIVSAPGISSGDTKLLQEEFNKSMKDPNYNIVTNYAFQINQVDMSSKSITVSIIGAEPDSVDKLKKVIDDCGKDEDNEKDYVLVVNAPVQIH